MNDAPNPASKMPMPIVQRRSSTASGSGEEGADQSPGTGRHQPEVGQEVAMGEMAARRLQGTRAAAMSKSKWNPGTAIPKRAGWYERDYRNTGASDMKPGIYLDKFEPVKDTRSILYPGVWYVREPGESLNDARWSSLPWRKAKK